jgi:MYXO-CTERM domain-containing protein
MNFRMMHWLGAALGGAVTLLLVGTVPAKADLTSVGLDFNIENNQTGPDTVALVGTFFSVYGFMPAAGDYTSGTLTYPGPGSPQALSPGTFNGPDVSYQTPFLPDLPSLQAAYPTGTYTIQAFGPGGPSSAVDVSYAADAYGNTPALTAASFNSLQGLNASLADTLNFNGFTPSGLSGQSFIFLNITDNGTGTDVFADNFLASSTTGVTIPGGTLAANTAYTYELIYDDRIDGTDANGLGISTDQTFDTRTFGTFTTSATTPEPGYFAIVALGLAGLFVVRRRRLSRS